MTTTKIDQKEYLKRYLSGDKDKKKKKKKKDKHSSGKSNVRIIDDDDHGAHLPLQIGDDSDLFGVPDEAPQIVGIIDDRPPELKAKEDFNNSKWKKLATDGGADSSSLWGVPSHSKSTSEKLKASLRKLSPARRGRLNQQESDSDQSPPRRARRDSDESPPRKRTQERRRSDSDESPLRKGTQERRRRDSDESPPRKRTQERRRRDSDESPPRKRTQERRRSDSDESPPRRSRKDSPPRKSHQATKDRRRDSDVRKPQRSRKDSSESPPRRSRKYSDDSPPRRSRRDSDASPPRRYDRKQERDRGKVKKERSPTPPRRAIKQEPVDSDESPPRRPAASRRDSDASPPRKIKRERVSPPVRIKQEPRDEPVAGPSSSRKMTTTLDGKRAGLQDARGLKVEEEMRRQREKDAFAQMSEELSGRNARTVVREKSGRRRDVEEELRKELEKRKRDDKKKEVYSRWGKGVKQVEDYKSKLEEAAHEMSKPLARYADDEDLDEYLKKQERIGDPMLDYIRSKKKDKDRKEGRPEKPVYKGAFPDNRFGIRPGYRWDGVDRSNGFEKKWFEMMGKKKATEEEAYKYSVEDM